MCLRGCDLGRGGGAVGGATTSASCDATRPEVPPARPRVDAVGRAEAPHFHTHTHTHKMALSPDQRMQELVAEFIREQPGAFTMAEGDDVSIVATPEAVAKGRAFMDKWSLLIHLATRMPPPEYMEAVPGISMLHMSACAYTAAAGLQPLLGIYTDSAQ